ncbi:MAG: hypothetical protein QM699_01970 [Amaricoccus sp.]|uniref:hypothetical protein n=1 Tax=Amaricoccus sp. TaxID=1872485 RepID=UPI0039E5C6AA
MADMEACVRGGLGALPVSRLFVRAIRPGRTACIVVHAVVPDGTALDVAEADRLRGAILARLAARHGPMVADVIFTTVEAYAAPAAGNTGMTAAPDGSRATQAAWQDAAPCKEGDGTASPA